MSLTRKMILFALLICHYDAVAQWIEIDIVEDQFIETLSFLNDDLGYALARNENGNNPSIIKTSDGGFNWVEVNLPDQTGEFQDICFYEEGKGVLLMRDLNNSIVPTMLYRTQDDGESWEDISPEATLNGVGVGQCQFLDEEIGFFATDKVLYTTIDGGENWILKEFDAYILAIDFLDKEHGTIGTWDGTFSYKGGMFSTSDGGLSWTQYNLSENYSSILEVRQISHTLALAAPVHSWPAIQAGPFYKTTDGGMNWSMIEIPIPENDFTLRQIDFKDALTGVICVGNTSLTYIYKTTDGGETWFEEGEITSSYNSDLQLTPSSGYIGGKTGSLYKKSTTNALQDTFTGQGVQIFPSPVQSGRKINWKSAEKFNRLSILDQTGKMVHEQYVYYNEAKLPLLNPGLYFVHLANKRKVFTTLLIIE